MFRCIHLSSSSSTLWCLRYSLGGQFRQQLTRLMNNLSVTYPHYIRCVKPTPYKQPLSPHAPMVLEQLRYSGVFEAVEIRKKGYV